MRKAFCIFILAAASGLLGCSSVPLRGKSDFIDKMLYRRVHYRASGDYRQIGLFYASCRQIREAGGNLTFSPALSGRLTAGTFDCRINPRLKIGKVIPEDLKGQKVVTVHNIKKISDSDFINELSGAVNSSPHKSLLVLIYGFKDDFEMTAIKAGYFTYLLDIDTPVLLFDWPGDQPVAPWGYGKAVSLAQSSGAYLGQALARIIREVKPKKLWIESSSLGCQVVCSAFEWMYKQPDLADPVPEMAHVVMSAPDVARGEYGEDFKNEVLALTDKVTAYVSSNDTALLMAGIIKGEKEYGLQDSKITKQDQFNEAKGLLYLKAQAPDKISIVDVTPINRASYHHGYDLEAPEFYDDFYMRLFDVPAHNNRRLYIVNVDKNVDYWIMRSDW